MTCYVVLALLRRFGLEERKQMIIVSENAAQTSGTSADLRAKDQLSVWDLLHGLMLPSGNDAAILLAEFFGGLLIEAKDLERFNVSGIGRRSNR
jgi:D-alanyl-D-alanine carboxypeptidase